MRETWVRSLGREDPLEKEMVTLCSILAWRIPWMEKPGRLQSTSLQRVGHDCDFTFTLTFCHICFLSLSLSLYIHIFFLGGDSCPITSGCKKVSKKWKSSNWRKARGYDHQQGPRLELPTVSKESLANTEAFTLISGFSSQGSEARCAEG